VRSSRLGRTVGLLQHRLRRPRTRYVARVIRPAHSAPLRQGSSLPNRDRVSSPAGCVVRRAVSPWNGKQSEAEFVRTDVRGMKRKSRTSSTRSSLVSVASASTSTTLEPRAIRFRLPIRGGRRSHDFERHSARGSVLRTLVRDASAVSGGFRGFVQSD
jgi:hypothetical protein